MTMITIEGFDHMSSPGLMQAKNWDWVPDSTGFWVFSFTSGRVIGKAIQIGSGIGSFGSNTMQFAKILPANYTQFVCGFAFKMDRLPHLGGTPPAIWWFANPSNASVVEVNVTSDARLSIAGYTSPVGSLTAGAWHYVEVKAVIAGASSVLSAQLDGGLVIPATTLNLGSTGVHFVGPRSWWDGSVTWEPTLGNNLYYDDMYFFDTSAAPNNDFIGDCRVETIYPNGVGNNSDWIPDSGSNWQRVNEHTSAPYPDGDTSYVRSNTAGAQDTYDCNDLSIISGTIYGLQTNVYTRKEDTALHKIDALVRSGGTNYPGADKIVASGYTDFTDIWQTDPATALAWTIAGVNAAQFGQKLVV